MFAHFPLWLVALVSAVILQPYKSSFTADYHYLPGCYEMSAVFLYWSYYW